MSDDRTWEASHDRTPAQNLRALLRHLDPETPTAEITRIAFIRIPGLGPGDERIVETIREEFADEHALARAEQWLGDREEPPQITLDEDRRRLPSDTDGVVHPAEVRAVLAHRLGARAPRTCENGSLIACNGPDEHGCRCPKCGQQRRREDAILDELLRVTKRAQMDERRGQTPPSDASTETERDDDTTTTPEETTDMTHSSTDDETTQTDRSTTDQLGLDAFGGDEGGETA